jgi:hypothetical protein
MADDRVPISVRVPTAIKAALAEQAKDEDRTLSAEIVRALRLHVSDRLKAA